MAEPQHGMTDRRVEQILGNLLRVGVLVAAAVVAVGAVIHLAEHGSEPFIRRKYKPPANAPRPVEIAMNSFSGNGSGLIQLGLLLLIATPVARVVFSVFAFGLQRDYTYVGVTLIVLAVLVYSLLFGHP